MILADFQRAIIVTVIKCRQYLFLFHIHIYDVKEDR